MIKFSLSFGQIENLFYSMTARRKALQNSADDYPKIVDLLSRFAIHHINVNFSCRKVLTHDTASLPYQFARVIWIFELQSATM